LIVLQRVYEGRPFGGCVQKQPPVRVSCQVYNYQYLQPISTTHAMIRNLMGLIF
jgi:hypothetical protein